MAWTKEELLAYALGKGFDVTESMTKTEILDVITAG